MSKTLKRQFEQFPKDIQYGLLDIFQELEQIPCIRDMLKVYKEMVLYNSLNLIQYGYSSSKGRYYNIENFNRQKNFRYELFSELKPFISSYCEDMNLIHGYTFKIIHPNEIIKKFEDKKCPYSQDIIEILLGKKRHIKRTKEEKESIKFLNEINKVLSKPFSQKIPKD